MGRRLEGREIVSLFFLFLKTLKILIPCPLILPSPGRVSTRAGGDWLSKRQRSVGHRRVFGRRLSSQWPCPIEDRRESKLSADYTKSMAPLMDFPLRFAGDRM